MAMSHALEILVDHVRRARADKQPLCIRGGGSKDFYGGALQGEVLDTRKLAGISAYEPSELVVTVRAGTPLTELEAALAAQGQCLSFEPPHYGAGGTVGGMVAAGLAGPARAAVGGVRDFVLGATLLNGRCEVLSFGGQVMKNVAGYDVARALAGSLGVLGVILEVSLKVLPKPPSSATLRFELDQAAALKQLNQWGSLPLPIHSSAWCNGLLVVRLAGAQAGVAAAAQRLGGEVLAPALADAFWCGLRDHSDEFFSAAAQAVETGASLWRLSVPQTAPPLALSGQQLVEWGGAQRWITSSAPHLQLRDAAQRAGGHATRFRGPKADGVFTPLSAATARIQHALKLAFDPEGLFNRGRLVSDW
jgi:glycolate oxidase FAD binding subunit